MRIIITLFMMLTSIVVSAQTSVTVDGIKYTLDSDAKTATVTYPTEGEPGSNNPNTYTGSIVIPASINVEGTDYNVTAIGKKAFRSSTITSISLPEGLQTIGKEAICKTNITEITVPNSVTKLEQYAIGQNSQLKTITFGEHIADNPWGYWVAWRSSGGYDVYMICDAMPTLPDEYTFDDSHSSIIHVKPELVDTYKADQWWGMHTIVPLGMEFIEFTVDGIKYKQRAEDEVSVTYSTENKPGSSNPNLYSGDVAIPAQVTYEGKNIVDACSYAILKGIKPLIWYNSSVGWINGAPGPKFRLNKPEDREKEFAWCEKIGIAGVKIDFFSGDNQMNMDYCLDLLECAARHNLLVNFHGAPIPRGWQRTYPNLLSTEGVYGAEWYNNVATFTDKAACHNATLPFTRNVIGPMDYTPCAFSDSRHPHITTNAHELALTVLYESGLQHLADRPESFLSQPQEVQSFFGKLPTVWDETRFVSGYPGEAAVLARRSGNTWYVAGINGKDEPQTLKLPLGFLPKGNIQLFADGEGTSWSISNPTSVPKEIACQPRGGFVMMISK